MGEGDQALRVGQAGQPDLGPFLRPRSGGGPVQRAGHAGSAIASTCTRIESNS
jgi:hypothetical protein